MPDGSANLFEQSVREADVEGAKGPVAKTSPTRSHIDFDRPVDCLPELLRPP